MSKIRKKIQTNGKISLNPGMYLSISIINEITINIKITIVSIISDFDFVFID